MRSLLILAQNASPRATQAGHKLAFEFAKNIVINGQLDVVLLINNDDQIDSEAWHSIRAQIVYCERFGLLKKIISIFANIFTVPPRFCSRLSKNVTRNLNKLVALTDYDEIIFEFSQVMPYVQKIKCAESVKKIASVHDVQAQVVFRSNFLEKIFFYNATAKYESGLIKEFDIIYTLSGKDRQILSNNTKSTNVKVRAPIIDSKFHNSRYNPDSVEKGSMLFWGAMDRKENDQAAKFLLRKIFPEIKKKIPYARIYIVGNKPSSALKKLEADSVVITGYVEEPLKFFKKAQIGVIPLARGAGVKIKTLEMLSFGMPVISTRIGAEGIEQDDNLIVEDLHKFADKIIEYFKSH